MPTYEYECEKCGHKFEIKRGIFARRDNVKCPVCGEEKCRQVYSGIWANSPGCEPPGGGYHFG